MPANRPAQYSVRDVVAPRHQSSVALQGQRVAIVCRNRDHIAETRGYGCLAERVIAPGHYCAIALQGDTVASPAAIAMTLLNPAGALAWPSVFRTPSHYRAVALQRQSVPRSHGNRGHTGDAGDIRLPEEVDPHAVSVPSLFNARGIGLAGGDSDHVFNPGGTFAWPRTTPPQAATVPSFFSTAV